MNSLANKLDYQILICMIEIWPLKPKEDPLKVPEDPLVFTEVENIEIEESYKKLISEASVKFPRGTILRRTLTLENGYIYDGNINANLTSDGVISEAKGLTFKKKDEKGEWFTVPDARLAEISDFKIGDRINISLGYTNDPEIAELARAGAPNGSIYSNMELREKYRKHLTLMFQGYITKVSFDTPIELECENLASVLKSKNCPKYPGSKNDSVAFFFDDNTKGGKKLLDGTGLKLYPDSKNIIIGPIRLDENLVVADLLDIWANRNVYSFIKIVDGVPMLAVGRAYFSKAKGDSIMKLGETHTDIPTINFDFNVARNNLTMMNTDKNFVAVEAQCLEHTEKGKDKFYKIVVIKNLNYDPKDPKSKPYRIVNEGGLSAKEIKAGKYVMTANRDKVDLKKYNIIPYMSPKIDCPHTQLLDEAAKYLEEYNPNGIDGTLTLFGDLALRPALKVKLQDNIHSGKNGYYFIDEVKTEFGVGGYRQTIKLPYCISRDNEQRKTYD